MTGLFILKITSESWLSPVFPVDGAQVLKLTSFPLGTFNFLTTALTKPGNETFDVGFFKTEACHMAPQSSCTVFD